jgi:ribonuclease P protein component
VLLSLGWAPSDGPDVQVGIRTRRGLKGAVRRNRLKRQLRDIVRRYGGRFGRGVDVVIVAHPKSSLPTSAALEREFVSVLERARVAS